LVNLQARFDHTFGVELIIAAVVAALVMAVFLFAIGRSFTPWGRRASQKHKFYKSEGHWIAGPPLA
jgi:lipopolysaccharide export LptBFGC system permease protein LptF